MLHDSIFKYFLHDKYLKENYFSLINKYTFHIEKKINILRFVSVLLEQIGFFKFSHLKNYLQNTWEGE